MLNNPLDDYQLIPEEDRKQILFEVAIYTAEYGYGISSNWRCLCLLNNIASGNYYDETNNSGIAKFIKANNPELYDKISVFFAQNKPDGWDD